jgi:hypothetical protein
VTVAPEYSTDSGAGRLLGGRSAGTRTPVLIGGHGPRLLHAAARHADLCNVGFDLPADRWRDLAPLLFDDLPRLAGLRSFAEAVTPALHTGGNEGAEPL